MKVGILGTGQLALMMARESQNLGIEVVPFGPENSSLLSEYCQPVTADLDDQQAIAAFANSVDVITYETENIDIAMLENLNLGNKLLPTTQALKIFGNRLQEKQFFNQLNIDTARYAAIAHPSDLENAARHVGFPAILKTAKGGYDGKGQQRVNDRQQLAEAWDTLDNNTCILEAFFDFEQEISVIAARDINRNIIFYPVSENIHRDGILRLSMVTGYHPLQGMAEDAIRRIMTELDYIGCMTLECFVKEGKLYANEVAPRVHNSGHWTIEGANSSQFVKHLKAIAGKPVFRPSVSAPVAMINLIGEIPTTLEQLKTPYTFLHDYGKTSKPERKLGHLTLLGNGLSHQDFYATLSNLLEDIGEKELASLSFNQALQLAS